MKVFSKVNYVITRVFWVLSVVILMAMFVIMTINVFGRMFGWGLTWSEEFGRYGQVVMVNLGAVLCMFDDSHISMSVLTDILKGKAKKILKLVQYIIMIGYGVVIIILSKSSLELASLSKSTGMGIPMTVVYAVYPIMGVGIIIHCIYLICKQFQKEKEEKAENGGEVTEA